MVRKQVARSGDFPGCRLSRQPLPRCYSRPSVPAARLGATPAWSTASNLSAQGPILPINAALLALTPISAFRPRRWRGALLPNTAFVVIEVLEGDKRPVAAVADHDEVRDVRRVEVLTDKTISMRMLFDPGHSLEERILREQFGY